MAATNIVEEWIKPNLGLNVSIHRSFLSKSEEETLFSSILKEIKWYRVKYASERHGNLCETPCWTNMYGGFPDMKPYQEIPPCLYDVVEKVSLHTKAKYNAVLVRLYFDGKDNIAWHTDGRIFLGPEPVISSLSLGGKCKFQLRKMTEVWPCTGTPNGGVDEKVPQAELLLKGGDLLVMAGRTQQEWHHRVPQEPSRNPRININFRYIINPEEDKKRELAKRGIHAFYKYMAGGDLMDDKGEITAPSFTYEDIIRKCAPLTAIMNKNYGSGSGGGVIAAFASGGVCGGSGGSRPQNCTSFPNNSSSTTSTTTVTSADSFPITSSCSGTSSNSRSNSSGSINNNISSSSSSSSSSNNSNSNSNISTKTNIIGSIITSNSTVKSDTSDQLEVEVAKIEPKKTKWICGACTFENTVNGIIYVGNRDIKCEMCGTKKPTSNSGIGIGIGTGTSGTSGTNSIGMARNSSIGGDSGDKRQRQALSAESTLFKFFKPSK